MVSLYKDVPQGTFSKDFTPVRFNIHSQEFLWYSGIIVLGGWVGGRWSGGGGGDDNFFFVNEKYFGNKTNHFIYESLSSSVSETI